MTEGGADLRVVTEIVGDASCNLSHLIVRGWHLVVVRGEMGGSSVGVLQRVLDGASADGGKMIVDLARCSAITTECVEALFTANKTLRKTGGEFMLVVDGVAVLQAIRAAGFAGRFEIHRYVGDIVGAVPGLDEGGRGRRRDMVIRPAAQ